MKKHVSFETQFLFISIGIVSLMIILSSFLINFLATHMSAILSQEPTANTLTKFDINGFEKLKLGKGLK